MRRAVGLVAILLLLAGSFSLGLVLTRSHDVAVRSAPPVEPARARVPRAVDEVRSELLRSYYRPVKREALAAPTLDALLEALGDPNTDYLTAPEYDALKNRTARSYAGVGLRVEPARIGLLVTSALRGPAKKAGIQRGDVIVGIDGKRMRGLTFEQSVALMKGEKGSVVHLTVRRPGKGAIDFTVVRQNVAVPSLRARVRVVRGAKIGHLRLLSFPSASGERVADAAASLVEDGARGLVLDLRDNPGGFLSEAVRTVSIFLDEGVVCTTDGLHQEKQVYEVTGRARHPNVPLVVLVDDGTASAAEIVAAALAENGRAVVVGRKTYGKASVQSIRPLSGGAALKLTTATYRTPSGTDLGAVGVRPRVRALDDPVTRRDEALVAAQRALLKQLRGA